MEDREITIAYSRYMGMLAAESQLQELYHTLGHADFPKLMSLVRRSAARKAKGADEGNGSA